MKFIDDSIHQDAFKVNVKITFEHEISLQFLMGQNWQ
jgi:hypothetical protein